MLALKKRYEQQQALLGTLNTNLSRSFENHQSPIMKPLTDIPSWYHGLSEDARKDALKYVCFEETKDGSTEPQGYSELSEEEKQKEHELGLLIEQIHKIRLLMPKNTSYDIIIEQAKHTLKSEIKMPLDLTTLKEQPMLKEQPVLKEQPLLKDDLFEEVQDDGSFETIIKEIPNKSQLKISFEMDHEEEFTDHNEISLQVPQATARETEFKELQKDLNFQINCIMITLFYLNEYSKLVINLIKEKEKLDKEKEEQAKTQEFLEAMQLKASSRYKQPSLSADNITDWTNFIGNFLHPGIYCDSLIDLDACKKYYTDFDLCNTHIKTLEYTTFTIHITEMFNSVLKDNYWTDRIEHPFCKQCMNKMIEIFTNIYKTNYMDIYPELNANISKIIELYIFKYILINPKFINPIIKVPLLKKFNPFKYKTNKP